MTKNCTTTCTGCARTEERTRRGVRAIHLNAKGLCAACVCAEEEAALRCPDCNGLLTVERDVLVDEPYFPKYPLRDQPLPRRQRTAKAVAFCGGCEFCIEIER